MRTWIKWIFGVAIVALLGVSGAWMKREDLALYMVSKTMEKRYPQAPNQPVPWSRGSADTVGERPPNVVMILADDLGWNDISLNGGVASGTVPTPHIDSIAKQGVTFTNGYAANGTCAPSRAAIMSGRYGTRFGFEFTPTPAGMMTLAALSPPSDDRIRGNISHNAEELPYEEMGMPPSELTIAELLKARDYHTVHIGKWHLGTANGMDPRSQGFDESLLMASGLYLPEDHPDVVNSKQDFDPIDRFLWAAMRYAVDWAGERFAPEGYLTDYFTDQAVEVIENNKERPFFLYLAHWAPHTPLQALREDYDALSHIENHRERVYAAMIRSLDRGVGQVLEALEENGLSENTLVMFTSDNGGAGYIGLPEINAPYRGWKITLFEGGIHVPFMAKWPARIPAGITYDAPVQHFDLYATAAAAGGAALPTDRIIDGVDLLPYLAGQENGVPHRQLFWRSGASQSALVDGWKLNVSNPPGRSWLFNLRNDPTEQNDLSEQYPAKVTELQAALDTHNAAQAEPAWPSQASAAVNIDKDLSLPDAPDDEFIYWSN
ncbi:sulfatase-like hydrolase/transferase [Congregibacter sp.]|uniref:sulfatase-like hydrolase/transferase n=1 Tax=Congregibacter sp. TaxID=2744308 RepID=UPI003F6BCB7B